MAKAKKEPNTDMQVRAENTLQIATNRQGVIMAIVDGGGECTNEQLDELFDLGAAIGGKAESIAHVDLRFEMDCEYFKAVEEAARAKRKSIEKLQSNLRKYLRDCLIIADMKSIKGDLFTFSVVDGRASVNIHDENKLPCDLCRVVEVIKPDSKAILERLQAGETVSGASLEYGEKYLMIRRQGAKTDGE